jgi:2-haloacid dehalogenase
MAPPVRALVFDAYGTLFDPFAVKTRAEDLFPGNGAALSQLWRAKQLEYSWLRTLMGRYENFWKITEDALVFSCRTLKIACDEQQRKQLIQVYLTLPAYPEVRPALEKLSSLPLSILSNGTLEMLTPLVAANNMTHFFRNIFSVDALQIYKPRPEVYKHAVTGLGISIFVPDLASGISPADHDPCRTDPSIRRRCRGKGEQHRASKGSDRLHLIQLLGYRRRSVVWFSHLLAQSQCCRPGRIRRRTRGDSSHSLRPAGPSAFIEVVGAAF